MMTLFYRLLVAVCLVLCLPSIVEAGKGAEPDIVVRLQTETPMIPVYVADITSSSASFPAAYLEVLNQTTRFDFDHNGMTQVMATTVERAAQAKQDSAASGFHAEAWRKLGVLYVIKTQVHEKTLSATVFSVSNGSVKTIDAIALTGDAGEDRRKVHLLSDAIHKSMFGTEGIASTRVLYTLRTKSDAKDPTRWVSEVWESDYDGFNPRQLTFDNSYCVTPIYVPPRKGYAPGAFMYVSFRQGQSKIFMGSVRSSGTQRLTTLSGNQLMPAVSPERNLVAFISDVAGRPDLFIQSFNAEIGAVGKPRQVFSSPRATQGSPTFSPDGSKLAFVSNKDGAPRIYVMSIDKGTGEPVSDSVRLISKVNKENTAPAWSPDGTKIAYSAMTSGTRQIWIYDCNKKVEWQLTQGAGHKENPAWAPNSLHLVFNSADNQTSELYIVNLNQPKATRVSVGSGEKRFPSWK